MSGRSVRAQQHEEVGKSTQYRGVVSFRTRKLFPMLPDCLLVLTLHFQTLQVLVGLEACCEHDYVCWNKAIGGPDPFRFDCDDFVIVKRVVFGMQ